MIALATALKVSTDELLGLRPPRVERVPDDAGSRRLWKRVQLVAALPEKDQRAVVRLIHSLAQAASPRRARAG